MTNLRTIPATEPVNRSIDVNGLNASIIATAKVSEDSPEKYILNWDFDFSGVDQKEILRLATASLVIDMQRRLRDAVSKNNKEALETLAAGKFAVLDILADRRRPKSAAEKLDAQVAKMDDSQIKALIEKLQSRIDQ